MYENNECACNEMKLNPRENSEKQICTRASDLLSVLREIGCMADRIEGILFASLGNEKKCDPTPSCLSDNIDMAMDEARVIAKTLDKIIQRL